MRLELSTGDEYLVKKGWLGELEVVYTLPAKPVYFRTYKYSWESAGRKFVSSMLSPKIMKLESGTYLMANTMAGTWFYDPAEPLRLRWILFGGDVQPCFRYDQRLFRRWIDVGAELEQELTVRLIETDRPFEVSFSKLPFRPVLIFTDHCDFDFDGLLPKQRMRLKEWGIRITKGVYIRKYSQKGVLHSSFEGNEEEFKEWVSDGHELCYHSVTQSRHPRREDEESLYSGFEPPMKSPGQFNTWIDHGYQRYNLTKSPNAGVRKDRLEHLNNKGITNVWNYFDCSESHDNLNQLDYRQMDPFRILLSRDVSISEKIRMILFHNSGEWGFRRYKLFAESIKNRAYLKAACQSVMLLLPFFWALFRRSDSLLVRRAQSVVFTEKAAMLSFQTILVKDFLHSFLRPYTKYKDESGLALVHCYFTHLGAHQANTFFMDEQGRVSVRICEIFETIGKDVSEGRVWNPTLSEFLEHIRTIIRTGFENPDTNPYCRYVLCEADR
jgi:hypothetical protein